MNESTIAEKIERGRNHAAAALDAYRAAVVADEQAGNPDPDDHALVGDLLADLLHLADRLAPGDGMETFGGPNTQTAYMALAHYEYERNPANADEQA